MGICIVLSPSLFRGLPNPSYDFNGHAGFSDLLTLSSRA